MTEPKENLKKKIDINQNQRIDNNEVDNFLKNNNPKELNELGEHLNNLPIYNNDQIKNALNNFFRSTERNKYEQSIKNKVTNNQPLDKTELSLMYLTMVSQPNKHLNQQQLIFDTNKPIDQICNGALIFFIRDKYNSPLYLLKKVQIELPSQAQKKKTTPSTNPLERVSEAKKIGGNIELPTNIPEIKENNADFYCERLITRAENNFPNEISKAKREIESKHRYKDDNEKQAYIRFDTLLIAFEKYTEIVGKKHNAIIHQAGYKNEEEFENQSKLIESFEEDIQQKYPGIDKVLSKIEQFGNEMKTHEKKYFKNENERKKAEQNNKEFYEYMNKKSKELDIDEIQRSLNQDPKTREEAEEYCNNLNKIFIFQKDISEKNKSYGDSITKYQKYIKGAIDIQKKHNIQEYNDILSNYNQNITNRNNKINLKKYENYVSLIQSDRKLNTGLKNISTLKDLIINQKSKSVLIKEFKQVERLQQIKQEETDKYWNNIKRFNGPTYRTLTTLTGLRNGLVDATVGTFTSFMVLEAGLFHGKNDAFLIMDVKEKIDNFFKKDQSSSQKEDVYNFETREFNFHADNTVSTVASSISQMLTLIYGGGTLAKGTTKAFGIGEKIAGKIGLFSSSFIMQVGGSYQEAITSGLSGGEALGYGMLSATIQSGLELVSPNEVLLGKGSGITKELIKNACKSGSKESLKMIGKTFAKNVGLEIVEENIQEALQLASGNLINMAANGAFGSELKADWSWKNFASTAIITTLTTGITTGTSTGLQMNNLSSQDKTKLIEHIKNDKGTYTEVTEMIEKAIAGEVKIPNVNIDQLKNLKLTLSQKTKTSGGEISIPTGKFKAPNEFFAETDESFREIVTKNPEKILVLNQIQDMDEFVRQSFEYIKQEMGIDDEGLSLKIIDKKAVDKGENNLYNIETNQVIISKDRAGHTLKHITGKGDRAEIFGAIVHELNHYLQNKEIVLSTEGFRDACIQILGGGTPKIQKEVIDEESGKKVTILVDMPNAMKDMIVNSYMKYGDNFDNEIYLKKAQEYKDSFDNYIEPIKDENQIVINYNEYKGQFVEDESFRRGDLVVDEYKRAIENRNTTEQFNRATDGIIRPATEQELQNFGKNIKNDMQEEYKKNLLKIAEFDIDIAETLYKQRYYVVEENEVKYIIEATKIDKITTLALLNMQTKQGLKNKILKKHEHLINSMFNILKITKTAQNNYELTMEILEFSKKYNLTTFLTIPNVVKLAKIDKDLALKIYKKSNKMSENDADNYINAIKINKKLALKIIDRLDDLDYSSSLKIISIVMATQKAQNFMNNIHRQFKENKLTIDEYYDISNAILILGEDFAYKSVDELTDRQKRILLNQISSRTHTTGRSKVIDEMFPCLPKMTDHKAIVNLINRLTKEINTRPQKISDNKITELDKKLETLYDHTNINTIKSIIEEYFPEYKEMISNETISRLQNMINRIIKNKEFKTLPENDKKITIISTLLSNLKRKGETQKDIAIEGYKLSLKFGFDEYDAKKIYSIVKVSNLIEQFMSTNKEKINHIYDDKFDITNRQEIFNILAFELKEGNTFRLAKLVYSSFEQEGFTRLLDKQLEKKINEIKANDFILYQTPIQEYKGKAHKETITGKLTGKSYNVDILDSNEIDNFYAIGHNPDGISFLKGNNPEAQRYAKLTTLEHIANERTYCGFYMSNENLCAIGDGFIFLVPNDKFYVASGHDIGSRGKTVIGIIKEYFIKNNVIAETHDYLGENETKNEEREMVSRNLKEILGINDDEYIKRLDNIKEQLHGSPLTPERLEKIDPKFASAYKEFYSRVNYDNEHGKEALLNSGNGERNEVIISNPQIAGIYTYDISRLSESMLIFAEENDIPIVILNKNK